MRINIIEHFWKAKMKMRFQQVGTNRQMNCALNSNKKFVFNIAGGQNSIVRCLFKIQLLQKFNYLKWPWRWLKHILHIHTRPFWMTWIFIWMWVVFLFLCSSIEIHQIMFQSKNSTPLTSLEIFWQVINWVFFAKFMRFSHDTILYIVLLKEKPERK